jgi:hypothetical protein
MRTFFFTACVLGVAVGCSSGRSDSSGTGGSAGASAPGGSGGSGASSNNAGAGNAGRGGSGATGGSSATGGSGGSSGAGGSVSGGGSGGLDCNCRSAAQRTVCGTDGRSYDATCGIDCVPIGILCQHTCPCESTGGFGGAGAGGVGNAGMAGAAAGAAGQSGIACGDQTCGPNQYCRAACSGTVLLDAGPPPVQKPNCATLPAACMGTASCECICGAVTTFCIPGATEVQCGCA